MADIDEINLIKARKFKEIKKIVIVYGEKDSKRVKSLNLKNVKLIVGGKIITINFVVSIFN